MQTGDHELCLFFCEVGLGAHRPAKGSPRVLLSSATRECCQARNTTERQRWFPEECFARGDVAGAMEYHHPEVIKALAFHKCLKGRDAVAADLRTALQEVTLEFVENQVDSRSIEGNTAAGVQQLSNARTRIPIRNTRTTRSSGLKTARRSSTTWRQTSALVRPVSKTVWKKRDSC